MRLHAGRERHKAAGLDPARPEARRQVPESALIYSAENLVYGTKARPVTW
ncbi:hypothetical protein ACFCWG_03155 [Streptomyces sp. NPDC056390]